MRRIAVLDAPSNLGLRPPTETSVPGCAKAPGALRDHGLLTRLGARDAGCLTPPRYDAGDWRPGDGVAHATQIAAYSRALADRIGAILDAGEFPVILGGDCSILLGSGIAMHRLGQAVDGHIGLVFVDGHSDFRHPGNASYVGAAAGEDLALVTGRGQPDLASIEGRRPYFRDVDVVVLGIRAQDEYRLDLQAAGIVTRPVPALRAEGAARSAQWARDQLTDCAGYWVHVDVDVLDPAVMPAVDAPSPGGIAFPELELLLAGLVESPHCLGVEITVFDPDYDPDGDYAAEITSAVTSGLAAAHRVALRPDLAAARRDLDGTPREHDEDAAPTRDDRRGAVAESRGRYDESTAMVHEGHADESDRRRDGRFDDEVAREHRRAQAAADSVSLAAAGASGGDFGPADEPALPATTLLAVEDGAELPAELPAEQPGDGQGAHDDLADPDSSSDKSGESDKSVDGVTADAVSDFSTDFRSESSTESAADPAAEPVGPAEEPADQAIESAGLGAELAGRAVEPAGPAAEPAGPGAEPAGPGAELAGSGAEPAGPGVEPAGRAVEPAGPAEEPAGRADAAAAVAAEAGVADVRVAEPVAPSSGAGPDDHGHEQNGAGHDGGRLGGRRAGLGPRRGSADSEASARWLTRTLGSAPLLDSEPLPATRPGMLRPRRSEPAADQPTPGGPVDPETDGFTLPVQRPAFDAGSDEPADIA